MDHDVSKLHRKLARAEAAGDDARVADLRARLAEAERDVERVTVLQEDCVALKERVRCIEGDPDGVMKLLVTRGVLQGDAL